MLGREIIFLLGAQDPAMREIEQVLTAAGMQYLHAARDGVRCAAGDAYAGKPIRYRALLPGGELKEMLKGAGTSHIERFMEAHADAGRKVYGNPYRGYAGAYIP